MIKQRSHWGQTQLATIEDIGDYNGDGREDILWQRDDGLVYVWLMNGASIASSGSLSGIGLEWEIVGGG
ncbi:hypothetical protein [Terricaulis sp.]|uniref:hypothetical protein n=1 Tax=Terricaulis sp. TaxID=2768686 RepID=UPI0037845845